MKILLLGGTGFVGRTIAHTLAQSSGSDVIIASRSVNPVTSKNARRVDATDAASLKAAIVDVDVIVNCMTGSGPGIRGNADAIVDAVRAADRPMHLAHMSSMAVYGNQEGRVTEESPLLADGNWYGQAKIYAENLFSSESAQFESVTLLRIGCVVGPESALWVRRIGSLLRSGRLGDLGEQGDGWSNLVHVADIARAVLLGMQRERRGLNIYNLSAPDSPRWNAYFRDFSLALDQVPVKYKPHWSMAIESKLIAPPLKVLERLSDRGWIRSTGIESIPPSLLRLWAQQIHLDSSKVCTELGLDFTGYDVSVAESANYFKSQYA